MNQATWRKRFKHCAFKFTDAQRATRGNLMCALDIPFQAHRCMFKKCPLLLDGADIMPVRHTTPVADAITAQTEETR